MVSVAELWLPILLSGVFVFIVSSIIHMVVQYHNDDFGKVPGEDEIRAAMRAQGVGPGSYMMPRPDSVKDCSTPEHRAKLDEGPVLYMTVLPNGPINMGKSLALWFGYCVLVAIFAGYLTGISTGPGAEYMDIFRRAGTVAILGFAVGSLQDSIWKGIRWKITGKFVLDGIIYGLVTAGTFAWMWPEAAAAGG